MDLDRQRVDLVLRHGHVITMDPERRILVDGAVAVHDGRIVAVGPDREIGAAYDGTDERELQGTLVHPGLIDAHVHAGTMEVIRAFSPKDTSNWAVVEHPLWDFRSGETDYLGALLDSMEMVLNGTTLYSDTGGSKDLSETVRALDTVGIRGFPGHAILDGHLDVDAEELADPRFGSMPPDEIEKLSTPTDEAIELLRGQLEAYPFRSDRRVRCAVTLFGSGRITDRLYGEAMDLAEEFGVPMIMHQSWGPEEVAGSLKTYGKRPIEHLADLGLLGPNLTLVHMIHLDDREVELVIESGAGVVHCPSASMRRGMGAIREGKHPEMLAAGVPVALGSDGYSSKRDLLRQAYLAAVVYREVRNDIPVFTGETVLEMATLHGARVLGMADEVGSIEVGKRADIVVHTLDRPEGHPRFQDPVDNLVFYRQSATIDTVFIDGEAVLDGGRFTRFDATEAYRRIDAKATEFEELIGASNFATWPLVT
jgi:cytosine/adenosine deaminase-related metal-dependent hydrolase